MSAETLERIELDVNGTTAVVLAVGDPQSPPLVYFHGAGTFHGAEFASAWAEDFRVPCRSIPATASPVTTRTCRVWHDLVLHYTELFDQLGLVR